MLGLRERWFVRSIVVAKNEDATAILIVVCVHQPWFRQGGIHKLSEVQFTAIVERQDTADKPPQRRALIDGLLDSDGLPGGQ